MAIVYHFLPSEFGLDDLRRRRVKIARLNEVNDPFELLSVRLENKQQRLIFDRHKQSMSKKFGLLCFAPDWSSPPMWTHYAANHSGMALGIDIPEKFLIPVKYNKSRVRTTAEQIARMDKTEGEKKMLEMLTTKSDHWSYERELRCFPKLQHVDENSGMYFKSFGDSDFQLREVILGHRCEEKISDIRGLVASFDYAVTVKRARPAFTKYAMVEQKDPNRS